MSVEEKLGTDPKEKSKNWGLSPAYDAVMRLPLTALAAYFLWREWEALESARDLVRIAVHVATMLFLVLIAGFTLARRRPVRRSVGPWPRFAALAGLLLLYSLMLLPRAAPDPRWDAPALGLLLLGQFFCVVALLQLGRSLSVMPEARRLVTAGLYGRIRHPLYLAEAIATLGVLLQFRSLEAFLLVALQFAIQLWRMREEEKVLEAAFPEYGQYRSRTARLIPGVY
jgi:protein-S-isoprenylcysteine O-methyltransferase Ste14